MPMRWRSPPLKAWGTAACTRAEPDAAEELGHAAPRAPPALHAVDEQRLSHEIEQRHAGIERGEGILEDHLHLAAQRPQLFRPSGPPRPPSRP
jgi:hypothetical protein